MNSTQLLLILEVLNHFQDYFPDKLVIKEILVAQLSYSVLNERQGFLFNILISADRYQIQNSSTPLTLSGTEFSSFLEDLQLAFT